MNRKFAIIGHRAQSTGKLNLNDLAGSCGRIDVLARAVNTGLFLSHGIRNNTDVTLHLQGGDGPIRRINFDGSKIRGLRPDERAIAGQIGKVLNQPIPPIGLYPSISEGLWHSGGGINHTINEWKNDNVRIFVLDANGVKFDPEIHQSNSVGFLLSDDKPFNENEIEYMEGLERISLGDTWLQGHACISIIHHHIDSYLTAI
jgi:tRNA (pseudouridine54-N1)-methyltransferase